MDIIHSTPQALIEEIKQKLVKTQETNIEYHNKIRFKQSFKPGDRVHVKTNK